MADQVLSTDTVAHDIARNPESIWLSPICDDAAHHGEGRTWAAPAPDETCEDCREPWVKYVRSDLASVSSASAEPLTDAQLKDAVSEMLSHRGERPERILRGGTALWETWVPAFRAGLRYLPASPEPVPATNQAEEVERNLEAQRQTIEACARIVEESWVIDGHMKERVAASVRALRPNLALATQPATSQEGEARFLQALERIRDTPDNLVPSVTIQRMRNIAGFALLGEVLQ